MIELPKYTVPTYNPRGLAGDSLPHGFTGKAKNEKDREFTIEY